MPIQLRVLLANQPTLYREAIATALRLFLPGISIRSAADPSAMRHFAPHLLIVSAPASPPISETVLTTILLYPDNADLAVVLTSTGRRTIPNIALADLVRICQELTTDLESFDSTGRIAAEPSVEWDGSVPYSQQDGL